MIIVTFGTFDLLHIGHIRILERCNNLKGPNGKLVVGVSSDKLNEVKKGRIPVYSQDERMEIIKSISYVDEVFLEKSLEHKKKYLKKYNADILVMGDDWSGKFDDCWEKVVYLPRTPTVSTTGIIEKIKINK